MPVSQKPRKQTFTAGKKNVANVRSPQKSAAKLAGMTKIMDWLEVATEGDVIATGKTTIHAAAFNNVSA